MWGRTWSEVYDPEIAGTPPLYNDDVNPNLTFTCIRNKTKLYRRDEKLPDLAPKLSEDGAQPAVSRAPAPLGAHSTPRGDPGSL